jgi:phospholipid/cholesterol/gamma-HCH transport system substrate-binding protein
MARETNVEFRVGVIILIVILIMAWSLYWLQGYKLESNSQLVQVWFDDVGTLSVGDKVTVNGVHKGKVNNLYLAEGGVIVDLRIYQDVSLRSDATFRIRNMGVMGERYVAIYPGRDSATLDVSVPAKGLYDTGLPELMGTLGDMTQELKSMVATLRKTVASDTSLERFNNTVANLERSSEAIVSYFHRNESKLDKTAENFLQASARLNHLLAGKEERVDSTLQRIERASMGLEQFVVGLDTLSIAARRLATAINEGDGTMQAMLEDRRLYDDLRKTADDLDDLILDIRENPSRYIKLKVEIF